MEHYNMLPRKTLASMHKITCMLTADAVGYDRRWRAAQHLRYLRYDLEDLACEDLVPSAEEIADIERQFDELFIRMVVTPEQVSK
jgi:hypothetical protein